MNNIYESEIESKKFWEQTIVPAAFALGKGKVITEEQKQALKENSVMVCALWPGIAELVSSF